jgi:hypothetical protein
MNCVEGLTCALLGTLRAHVREERENSRDAEPGEEGCCCKVQVESDGPMKVRDSFPCKAPVEKVLMLKSKSLLSHDWDASRILRLRKTSNPCKLHTVYTFRLDVVFSQL